MIFVMSVDCIQEKSKWRDVVCSSPFEPYSQHNPGMLLVSRPDEEMRVAEKMLTEETFRKTLVHVMLVGSVTQSPCCELWLRRLGTI